MLISGLGHAIRVERENDDSDSVTTLDLLPARCNRIVKAALGSVAQQSIA